MACAVIHASLFSAQPILPLYIAQLQGKHGQHHDAFGDDIFRLRDFDHDRISDSRSRQGRSSDF